MKELIKKALDESNVLTIKNTPHCHVKSFEIVITLTNLSELSRLIEKHNIPSDGIITDAYDNQVIIRYEAEVMSSAAQYFEAKERYFEANYSPFVYKHLTANGYHRPICDSLVYKKFREQHKESIYRLYLDCKWDILEQYFRLSFVPVTPQQ